jgi:superfamily II DNA/RNA helicase
MHFSDLGIAPTILRALETAGYTSPTGVQAEAIPAAIAGRDLLVSAQTGSGKTAAFLLPALTKLSERSTGKGQGPRVLVLCPTRELAQQVEKNALEYGKDLRWMKTACLVGGASFGYQTRALSRPIDLIVATPGRLMDHMRSGRVDFSRLEMLVLDEADRMLDMGFIEDIETIVKATRKAVRPCCSPPRWMAPWAAWLKRSPAIRSASKLPVPKLPAAPSKNTCCTLTT